MRASSHMQASTSSRCFSVRVCPRHATQHTPRLQHLVCHSWRQLAEATDEELDAWETSSVRLDRQTAGLEKRLVQWYPGHIARAERQLKEQLKRVDVVMEVRDARIPLSTRHPQIPDWVGSKPLLLIMNRADMVSTEDRQRWQQYWKSIKQRVVWTNGVTGDGVKQVVDTALHAAQHVKRKRESRGLQPRAVRAVVVGFPNVGKSALINRLVGRRACDSAPKPGVTRQLRWVRLGTDLDMLDAPGVLPMSFSDQVAAQRLAICNDIGEASYVDSLVAAALLENVRTLPGHKKHMARLQQRYGVPFESTMTGEDFVHAVAEQTFVGEVERAGARVLKDYRTGALGWICLEPPPKH